MFHFLNFQFNFLVGSKGFRTAEKRLKKDSAKVRAISSSTAVFMGFIRNERFSETPQVSCILQWVQKIFGITLKVGYSRKLFLGLSYPLKNQSNQLFKVERMKSNDLDHFFRIEPHRKYLLTLHTLRCQLNE